MLPIVSLFAAQTIGQSECMETTTPSQQTWHCEGPYSKLTYQDCQGLYYDSEGCYFLEHFAQYRPCAQICNDVVVHSMDEEKCRAYCDGYFTSACKVSSSEMDASTQPPLWLMASENSTSQPHPLSINSAVLLSTVGTVSFLMALIVILLLFLLRRRMRHQRSQTLYFKFTKASTTKGVEESQLCSTDHDTEQEYYTHAELPSDQDKRNDMTTHSYT